MSVQPPRADLCSRRERIAARALLSALGVYERARSRLLVDVPDPAGDPFHQQSEDVAAFAPGDVIDVRPVQIRALRHVLKANAWHVRFATTDGRGDPVSGVTTVIVPHRPYAGEARPLLSYQCAIDSLSALGDPSYTLRHGDSIELPFLALALRRGWVVTTTDYTGPRHAFAAGQLAARFVLDGIRAAIGHGAAGITAATPIGLWGYSGGAYASLCAAELQPTYAPDLHLVGVAVGGLTVDPATTSRTFEDAYDGSILSGIPLGAIVGVSREHPEVDFGAGLNERGLALLAAANDLTMVELLLRFPFLHWGEYLTVPGVLDIPGLRAAFEANRYGTAAPSAPMYVYHGIHEQNLRIDEADALVDAYRRMGTDVTYERIRIGGHMLTSGIGAPGALRFLRDRFGVVAHA